MEKLLDFFSGYKTYMGILFGALYYSGHVYFGYEISEYVLTAVATWTGVSMRYAIKKAEK